MNDLLVLMRYLVEEALCKHVKMEQISVVFGGVPPTIIHWSHGPEELQCMLMMIMMNKQHDFCCCMHTVGMIYIYMRGT